MVRDSQVMNESVQVLGESLPLSELSITKLEEVVCRLYNDNQCKLVNDLRYKMFCKGKNVQCHQLPPTSAALHYHLKRTNYQAFLWKKALQPRIDQEPVNHGWQLTTMADKCELAPFVETLIYRVECKYENTGDSQKFNAHTYSFWLNTLFTIFFTCFVRDCIFKLVRKRKVAEIKLFGVVCTCRQLYAVRETM